MKRSLVTAAGLLLATAWFSAGCRPSAQPPALTPPPPTVTVAPVEKREIVEYDQLTGRLAAMEEVEIRPRVSGYLTEVRFQAGQLVQRGDVLFVIDPRPKQAAADRAEAEVKRARVRLDNARREAERARQLIETRAMSVEEADQRLWAATDAEAALQAAEAALATARIELDYCTLKSPINGRVSRALVTVGNNVSGVDGFTTLLTTVVSVDPIYAYADVDELMLLKFRRLQAENQLALDSQGRVGLELGVSDDAGYPHRGYIESWDNRLDPATGSIVLRAVLPNPEGKLVPGLFAAMRIPGSPRKTALLIHEHAVGTDQNQKFVLALTSSNTVAYRAVKLGPLVEGGRVVREGLSAGEEIVVNGLMRVQPGMPVTPQRGEGPKVAQR